MASTAYFKIRWSFNIAYIFMSCSEFWLRPDLSLRGLLDLGLFGVSSFALYLLVYLVGCILRTGCSLLDIISPEKRELY